jgi:hypothetical protein
VEWRNNLDTTRNGFQLTNASRNTYTSALIVQGNIPWKADSVAFRTSASDTVTPYRLVTLLERAQMCIRLCTDRERENNFAE